MQLPSYTEQLSPQLTADRGQAWGGPTFSRPRDGAFQTISSESLHPTLPPHLPSVPQSPNSLPGGRDCPCGPQ